MPKAYSYLRFSTSHQMTGDSYRRQSTLAKQYAARHGLELDTGLTFEDLGISAFRGSNARSGALGAFLVAIDDGIVPAGSTLLVESLDRVSRQDPWDALLIFQQIVNSGVTIITLQDEKIYSREEMRQNPLRILESLKTTKKRWPVSAVKSPTWQSWMSRVSSTSPTSIPIPIPRFSPWNGSTAAPLTAPPARWTGPPKPG